MLLAHRHARNRRILHELHRLDHSHSARGRRRRSSTRHRCSAAAAAAEREGGRRLVDGRADGRVALAIVRLPPAVVREGHRDRARARGHDERGGAEGDKGQHLCDRGFAKIEVCEVRFIEGEVKRATDE
eukprot:scaffold28963_cov63-Phaeocystis_antarctica.AAC.4